MQNIDPERLKIVLEKLDIDPPSLALSLDYKSPSIIYNILKGKENMDIDFIIFFIKKYPQVNFMYLKDGKGEPILTISEAISQRSILGLSDKDLNIEGKDTDQHHDLIEKRLNIIEEILSKQNRTQDFKKDNLN